MTRFSFKGHPVDDEDVSALPDHCVLKDRRDGDLIVRRRTERYVPVPAVPTPREASEK